MTLNELGLEAHRIAREHGWHDTPVTFPERIALIHSELSEALEEYRAGHRLDEEYELSGQDGLPNGKPEGVPSELADVVIRVVELCATHGIDLDGAVARKMAFNERRPFRHGGKRL